jgi:HAD superfamily hydrolase (TIGR01549 family)
MKNLSLRAVLFDLDDTLFDHHTTSLAGVTALQGHYPALQQMTFDHLARLHSEILETLHSRMLQGEFSLDQARHERFRQLFAFCGEAINEEQMAEATHLYRQAYLATRRTVPGALPLLQQLHGRVRIAIVSNNVLTEQQDKLAQLGLAPYVDDLIVAAEVGVAKPEPAIFHEALRCCQCMAAEAVMVGDSWAADIVGAARLGIRSIWLNRHGAACPDPTMAAEIDALEPVDALLALIFAPAWSNR